VKTTLDLPPSLLAEAKVRARARHIPLRQLVEEGLRMAIDRDRAASKPFRLRDASRDLGEMLVPDSWPEIRKIIYEGRGELAALSSPLIPTSLCMRTIAARNGIATRAGKLRVLARPARRGQFPGRAFTNSWR